MDFEVNVAEIRAEMGRHHWRIKDLAEIWQVNRNTAATYLNEPAKIPYRQMLLLAAAAGWDQRRMCAVFFQPKPAAAPEPFARGPARARDISRVRQA